MKKSVLLLGFLAALTNAQAQQKTLSIHQQGGATILDQVDVKLQKGINQIEYNQFVSSVSPESIFLFVDGTPVQFNHQRAASFDELLLKYKGENITVRDSEGESFSGKFIEAKYNGLFLELRDGSVVFLMKSMFSAIQFPTLKTDFNDKEKVNALISSTKKEEKKMLVWYQSNAFRWNPTYKLVLNEKMTEASFQGLAQVNYSGEEALENVALRFNYSNLSNRVSGSAYSRNREMYEAASMKVSYDSESAQLQSESVGDAYEIVMDKKVTLKPKETQFFVLADIQKLPIKRLYEYTTYGGDIEKGRPNSIIEFQVAKKAGFKDPLAHGSVDIMLHKNNDLRSLSKVQISNTALEETVKLNMGNAFDIAIKETVTKSDQITKKMFNHAYKLEIKNEKNEKVRVKVSRNLDSSTQITDSSIKYDTVQANEIAFWVEIPAGKTVSFTYSTKTEYF